MQLISSKKLIVLYIFILSCSALGAQIVNPPTGGGSPTGAAGGALGGTYPNPTIPALATTSTANDFVSYSNTIGAQHDSGIAISNVGLLAVANTWTQPQTFNSGSSNIVLTTTSTSTANTGTALSNPSSGVTSYDLLLGSDATGHIGDWCKYDGSYQLCLPADGSHINIGQGAEYAWTSGAPNATPQIAGLGQSAGIVSVDTTTPGNGLGSIKMAAATINGGAAVASDGLILQLTSSNADQTGLVISNSTSSVSYFLGITGSNSVIPGAALIDANSQAVNWNMHSIDATHPINAMGSLAVIGFASGTDPTTTALSSGLSNCGAGCFAIGTGGQGSVDGSVRATTFTGALTGNSSTASALTSLPTPCSAGSAPTGILANGNSTGCTPYATASDAPLGGTTGSIGGSALLAGACAAGTATVTGATTSMATAASPSADPDSVLTTGVAIYSFVSAANTVTVRVCAIVPITPVAVTYNVRVIQ